MLKSDTHTKTRFGLNKLCGLVCVVLLSATFVQYAHGQTTEILDKDNQAYVSQLRIKNTALAEENWTLNCRGCHRLGAVGLGKDMPNMNGEVAKFLSVEGGVEYLSRVPGIANSPLNNEELADLVNWMLVRYDAEHIPADFTGFTAAQIGPLRKDPYNTAARTVRAKLIIKIQLAEQEESDAK